jgi:nucleoside-diphosphate kinase
MLDKHYPAERTEFVKGLGQRTIDSYAEIGMDPSQHFKTVDPLKIGHEVRDWLVDFMRSAPVLAMVLGGPHAIEVVRKIRGHTLPQKAMPGTITGDYSFDSSGYANMGKRPIRNLVHASGNAEEAEFEIGLWFSDAELFEYETIHQKHMTS